MDKVSKVSIVSHADDLDGVASAALVAHYLFLTRSHNTSRPRVVFTSYDRIGEAIKEAAEDVDEIFITDLCLRDPSYIDCLSHISPNRIHVMDHHTQTAATLEVWKDRVDDRSDFSDACCATDLVFKHYYQGVLDDMPTYEGVQRLVNITHSIDLWCRNIADDMDYSDMVSVLGPQVMYDKIVQSLNLFSTDFVTEAGWDQDMAAAVERAKKDRAASLALADRSSIKMRLFREGGSIETVPTITACLVMGYQSDIGEFYRKQETIGWVVMLDVLRDTLSFRTNYETIAATGVSVREIATRFGGGGHPCASGANTTKLHYYNGPKALVETVAGYIVDECDRQAHEKASRNGTGDH